MEKGFSQDRANFYGMLVNLDQNMDRLETFLKDRGLRENTIIIVMTDNGTAGPWYPKEDDDYTAGLRGIKGSIYEEGHRVLFFVLWPARGIGGGRDVDHLAAHIDVLPTLMELSGATRFRQPRVVWKQPCTFAAKPESGVGNAYFGCQQPAHRGSEKIQGIRRHV